MPSDNAMARVLVHVQNYMFADMITNTLEAGDFNVTVVDRPENVIAEFNRIAANVVLMEVNRQTPMKLEDRLTLRQRMKKLDPECKIVLLVDEKSCPDVAAKVRQAQRDHLINQFIYTSVSASYLLGVMETVS